MPLPRFELRVPLPPLERHANQNSRESSATERNGRIRRKEAPTHRAGDDLSDGPETGGGPEADGGPEAGDTSL